MYLTSSRPDIILISWQCKKQTIVANSITEVEYVAASSCCGQVLWIQNQLLDYGDSNEKKLIQMIKIHTDKNVADLLTKAFDVKMVNGEQQLQVLVDGKKIVVNEASVRIDLQLDDEEDLIMSDSKDSTVTYTAVSSPYEDSSDMGSPGVEGPPMMPEDPHVYVVAIFQALPSSDYVPGPEEPEQAPPSPVYLPYVPEPPLPAAASPTTESPGYIPESDLEEDDEEDPEEDPSDYPADRGDDGDDEESSDDDDDVEEDKEDEDEEEEDHLAPADPAAVGFPVDQDPSDEETEPFETDESAATPPSPPLPTYRIMARMSIRPQALAPFLSKEDAERAAGIRQRDTPPSPIHETEIPEICLPLHKRPCHTAPTPRYKVGESSAAGAARQDGPAIARADLYGFVYMVDAAPGRLMSSELGYGITDTWDDLVGSIQEIAPTTLEGVNQRVIELVATVDQEDGIMYSLLEDAREDRSLLRGRVNMLFRDRLYHRRTALLMEEEARVSRVAWAQSMDASDKAQMTQFRGAGTLLTVWHSLEVPEEASLLSVTSISRLKMAPKRRTTRATPVTDTPTTTSVTNAQLQAMIDQGVTTALAARDATKNGDDSHTLGTGVRRNERVVRECTYQDLMKCQPLYFNGTEGVVELTQWCSNVVEFPRYDCTDVLGYNQRFQELALLCVIDVLRAERLKGMSEAIEIATELMDKKIDTLAERQAESKRKLEDTSRNNQNQQQPFKRQNVARAYTAGSGDKKPYRGIKPLCTKCNYNHDGPLPKEEMGQVKGLLYEYGVQGHLKRECPKLKNNNNRGNQVGNARAPAKVYVVGQAGTN
ncbi:hypothetical protein Tco_0126861 [Tanacetum coccineum]